MYFVISAVSSFFAAGAFALLFHAPRQTILCSCCIGMVGYLLYVVLAYLGVGALSCYFFGALLMSALCEVAARRFKMPATVFLSSSLVTLVPGYDLYQLMLYLVQNDGSLAAAHGVAALQGVMAIAAATAACSVAFRAMKPRKSKSAAS